MKSLSYMERIAKYIYGCAFSLGQTKRFNYLNRNSSADIIVQPVFPYGSSLRLWAANNNLAETGIYYHEIRDNETHHVTCHSDHKGKCYEAHLRTPGFGREWSSAVEASKMGLYHLQIEFDSSRASHGINPGSAPDSPSHLVVLSKSDKIGMRYIINVYVSAFIIYHSYIVPDVGILRKDTRSRRHPNTYNSCCRRKT